MERVLTTVGREMNQGTVLTVPDHIHHSKINNRQREIGRLTVEPEIAIRSMINTIIIGKKVMTEIEKEIVGEISKGRNHLTKKKVREIDSQIIGKTHPGLHGKGMYRFTHVTLMEMTPLRLRTGIQ